MNFKPDGDCSLLSGANEVEGGLQEDCHALPMLRYHFSKLCSPVRRVAPLGIVRMSCPTRKKWSLTNTGMIG